MADDDERRPIPFVKPPRLSSVPPVAAGEGSDAGWVDLIQPASISHIPLADVIDVLASAGYEVRIQCRPKK